MSVQSEHDALTKEVTSKTCVSIVVFICISDSLEHCVLLPLVQISIRDEGIHKLEIEKLHLQEEMTKYKEEVIVDYLEYV